MSYFPKDLNRVPSSLLFPLKAHSNDIILNKQTTRIEPYTSVKDFKEGSQIKFKLTGDKALDLRTLVLNFDLQMLDADGKKNGDASYSVRDVKSYPFSSQTAPNVPGNAAPQSHFHNHAASFIKSLKIKLNDTVMIEEFKFYNLLRCMIARMTVDKDYASSFYGAMEGCHPSLSTWDKGLCTYLDSDQLTINRSQDRLGDPGDTISADAITEGENYDLETAMNQLMHIEAKTNKEYTIRLDLSGLLGRFPKIMYLPCVGSIDLEINLEKNSTVINLDTESYDNNTNKALSYVMSNVHMQAELYDLTQPYLGSLKNKIDMEGLTIELTSYLTYDFNLNNSDQQTLRLWRRLSSLKSIFFGIKRIPINEKDQRAKKNELEEWCNAGLESYLVFIDGRPVSAHPISTLKSAEYGTDQLVTRKSESTWELTKAINNHVGNVVKTPNVDMFNFEERMKNSLSAIVSDGKDDDVVGSLTKIDVRQRLRYVADQFCVYGVDLEKSELISGTSLSNELSIQLRFNPNNDLRLEDQSTLYDYKLFVFLYYDKRVGINSGLRITELE
jgi:hypothetical protein